MVPDLTTHISSPSRTVEINRQGNTVIIGERINPTGRKKVLQALRDGDFDLIRQDAIAQVEAGADVLDINAGVIGADETNLLKEVIKITMEVVDVPLCIDTTNPDALSAALEFYTGKALINSVNGEKRSMDSILPLAKEHGAAVIGLCMDDDGIPETPEGRLKVAAKIIGTAESLGIPPEDIVIDPLAMTMSTNSNAGRVALETIQLVVAEFGVNVTLGASNISFGLPDRKYVNASFLAMAIFAGLTCPITNPLIPEVSLAVKAAALIMGRDEYGRKWIGAFRERKAKARQ